MVAVWPSAPSALRLPFIVCWDKPVGLEVTLPDIFFRIDNSDVKNASRGFWTLFVASRDGQHPKTVPIPKIGVTLEEIYKILRG